MRLLMSTIAAASLALLAPRSARACSYDPCYYDSQRIGAFELLTTSPVPRDGAFVLATDQEDSPACLAELAPHLAVVVTHAGVAVPGDIVQLAGLPHLLIWRPTAPLLAGAYELQIAVDNDGLGPEMVDFSLCQPSPVQAQFVLTVGDALAETPVPPAPVFAAASRELLDSLFGVVCCPGVTPEYFDGSCEGEVDWDYNDPHGCGFFHGFTGLDIVGEPPPLPPLLAAQFVDQLVVDGQPVARRLADGPIAAFRRTAACARLERIQLGTGEVVASAEACPPPELAAQLGPQVLDPMLRCDDGQLCATDYSSWGDTCVPFDPGAVPAAMDWPYDTRLAFSCPDASAPLESELDAPTTGANEGLETSDGGPADGDPSAGGCACGRGSPSGSLLPLLLALYRRRRAHAKR